MMRRVASNPSIFGIWISIVMTSGFLCCTAVRASSPLGTAPITWISGSALRICTRNSLTVGESSTTKTLIMHPPLISVACSYQPTNNLQQVTLIKAAFDDIGIRSDLDAALPVCTRVESRHQGNGHVRE